MSRIKGRNTAPEIKVRSMVHRLGYRFRLYRKDLPGTPDLVFHSRKKIIFVHGCFWHGHTCAKGIRIPEKNKEYWANKIRKNKERDYKNLADLATFGWKVLIVWECELKASDLLVQKLNDFLSGCES